MNYSDSDIARKMRSIKSSVTGWQFDLIHNIHSVIHPQQTPYPVQGHAWSGAYPWKSGHEEEIHTERRGNVESKVNLPAWFWEVRRNWRTWRKAKHTEGEHVKLLTDSNLKSWENRGPWGCNMICQISGAFMYLFVCLFAVNAIWTT